MGRYAKNPVIGDNAFGITIPNVTTAQRPSGTSGQVVFNTTTSTFQAYISSAWYNISSAAGEKTLTVDKFQGDGTTTVFGSGKGNTLDGSTAATLSVTPTDASDMIIFVGGVYQVPTTNYTYSGGEITFGSAPPANDGATNGHIISVIHNIHKLGE
tara:strand:+ start:1787 stop:2254 length:468 start_codon:yes stop_codon:yes gene_type:complete